MKTLVYIILFFQFIAISKGQSWDQLENEYFNYLGSNKADSAVKTCYKMVSWIEINKKDKSFESALVIEYIGDALFYNNNFQLAKSYLNKSCEISKIMYGENHYKYFQRLKIYGDCLYQNGSYLESESVLSKLISNNYFISYDSINYVITLNLYGIINEKLGYYDKAENIYKRCLDLHLKVNDKSDLNYTNILMNLGNVNRKNLHFAEAELYYLEVMRELELTKGQNNSEFSALLHNLSNLYIDIGLYDKALYTDSCNHKIITNYIGEKSAQAAANFFNFGRNFQQIYELEQAIINYEKSRIITHQIFGNQHPYYLIILTNLGLIYYELNDFLKAKQYYDEAIVISTSQLGENSIKSCDILIRLSLINLKLKDINSAKLYLNRVKNIFLKLNIEDPELLCSIGQLELKIGNKLEGKKCYEKAFQLSIKNNLRELKSLSENQRLQYFGIQTRFFEELNTVGYNNFKSDSSFDELVVNGAIFSKGILLEIMNLTDDLLKSKKVPDYLIPSYNSLIDKRKQLSKIITENINNSNAQYLEFEIDSIEKFILSKTNNQLAVNVNLMVNWKDIQNSICSKEVAVDFTQYYDYSDSAYNYLALIIKSGDKYPRLVKICKVNELKQYSPESELKEIYDLVWKPLLPYLEGIKTVYYSPSGILNNIPFQALYKDVNGQREYVMDKFTLHQLTSTRYLALDLKKKEQETIETSIALFGGINYNDFPNAVIDTVNSDESSEAAFLYKNAIVLNRELDSTRTGASYLPGTKKEVETIVEVLKAKQWQVDISEGKNATENKIKSYSGKSSKAILHIATHGFAYPEKEEKRKDLAFSMMSVNDKYKASDNPMTRSGLLFGGANMTWQGKGDSLLNTTNEDGVLTAYELSQLDLSKTKLAVLSACETGKGAIQGSEGTFGLKRALKLAGVDNMIVSLWKVPDDATMEMMTLFYTELAKTKKPVSSFETAQKAMRFKYPNEPKMWAGFVFVR